MHILITGGAGFIGSHLALKLRTRGHEVHIVDNFDPYYSVAHKHRNAALLQKAGIFVHRLDLALDPLEGILEGAQAVIHLAAQPGNDATTSYASYIKNNFHATVALVEALRGTSVRFLHASTSSVYGLDATGPETTLPAPVSPYGVTKLAAEAAVQSATRRGELESCILRFFSVYGPRERPDKLFPKLFAALKHNREFSLYEGSLAHRRSFSYVGDIVTGALLALENWPKSRGEIFNLGSEATFTTAEALDLAQKISGATLKIKNLPPRPGDQLSTHAHIQKARDLLGFAPQTTLADGLTQTWAWAKENL